MANRHETLAIKQYRQDTGILGSQINGGLIAVDGKLRWIRHSNWRYNGNGWGRAADGFTQSDLSEVGYQLTLPPKEMTQSLISGLITELENGSIPHSLTTGAELEGSLYEETSSSLLAKHDDSTITIQDDAHPELLSFTVESATRTIDGHHPLSALDIAQTISHAVQEGETLAQKRQGRIVYTSVPEGGDFSLAINTAHPYLQLAAPRVLNYTLARWEQVPNEARELYSLFGINPYRYLQETGILNWPVQALHIHSGLPQHQELADSRVAYAFGQMRLTQFAKTLTFLLYNTRHFYSLDTNLKDVRSIARRLLATAHNGDIPHQMSSVIQQTVQAFENGDIHSPSRFPASGQHDRIRFRMEGNFKTIESIDAPMNPDLRLVLSWAYSNQLMNIIALDALFQVEGDESKVNAYLQRLYGKLFAFIPTIGVNGSFQQDLAFNKDGFSGRPENGMDFATLLQNTSDIIASYQTRYPVIKLQAAVVTHIIRQHLLPKRDCISLAEYFGIENGTYQANGNDTGIVTDYKKSMPLDDIIAIQHEATEKQAQQLNKVKTDQDIKDFFGIQ